VPIPMKPLSPALSPSDGAREKAQCSACHSLIQWQWGQGEGHFNPALSFRTPLPNPLPARPSRGEGATRGAQVVPAGCAALGQPWDGRTLPAARLLWLQLACITPSSRRLVQLMAQ
jgi:hypothetical protein